MVFGVYESNELRIEHNDTPTWYIASYCSFKRAKHGANESFIHFSNFFHCSNARVKIINSMTCFMFRFNFQSSLAKHRLAAIIIASKISSPIQSNFDMIRLCVILSSHFFTPQIWQIDCPIYHSNYISLHEFSGAVDLLLLLEWKKVSWIETSMMILKIGTFYKKEHFRVNEKM